MQENENENENENESKNGGKKFFGRLSKLMTEEVDLNIVIRKKGAALTISVLPQMKEGGKGIQPLVLKGFPHEIDQGFFDAFNRSAMTVKGLVTNLKEHQASIDAKRSDANKKGAKGKEKVKDTNQQDLFSEKSACGQ